MSRSRLELDAELRAAIGNSNVYFQPPESVKLKYPCIVYHRSNIDMVHADNKVYKKDNSYDITFITKDPDHPLVEEFLDLFSMISYNRSYSADNLNHYNYTLYY